MRQHLKLMVAGLALASAAAVIVISGWMALQVFAPLINQTTEAFFAIKNLGIIVSMTFISAVAYRALFPFEGGE